MGMFGRLFRRRRPDKAFIIAQVVARHCAWYPAHNRGREAPPAALVAWSEKLRGVAEIDLIRMIADNRLRNNFLGKSWPDGAVG